MNIVFILLGSNMDRPVLQLETARNSISSIIGPIESCSSIYKTAAWGQRDQPDFFNQVIKIRSQFPPEICMTKALSIEEKMGRKRKEKYGPRTIDIDLLLYNDIQLNSETLVIPHPEMENRRFTLIPLCELAPEMKHPASGLTMLELLTTCKDSLPVDKI